MKELASGTRRIFFGDMEKLLCAHKKYEIEFQGLFHFQSHKIGGQSDNACMHYVFYLLCTFLTQPNDTPPKIHFCVSSLSWT